MLTRVLRLAIVIAALGALFMTPFWSEPSSAGVPVWWPRVETAQIPLSTYIYDRTGQPVLFRVEDERRMPITLGAVPLLSTYIYDRTGQPVLFRVEDERRMPITLGAVPLRMQPGDDPRSSLFSNREILATGALINMLAIGAILFAILTWPRGRRT